MFRRLGIGLCTQLLLIGVDGRDARGQAEPAPLVLDPVTVEVSPEAERGDGAVLGYRAGRSTTATRTDTPILETPASVTVIPSDLSRDRGVRTAAESLLLTPGVAQRQSYQGYESITIRGLYLDEDSGYQIDGLRTRNTVLFDPALFERIEVLKGPASLLYGAMEPGGIVNYVTRRAVETPFAELGSDVASHADVRGRFDGAATVANGGFRFPLVARRWDTFRDGVDGNRYLGLMPTLELALGDRTTARLLTGYIAQDLADDTIAIPVIGNRPASIPRSRYLGPDGAHQTDRLFQSALAVDHRFTEGLRWRNTLSFVRGTADRETVANVFGVNADGRTLDPIAVDQDIDTVDWQGRTELLGDLALLGMEHRAVLGADAWRSREQSLADDRQLATVDIFAPANDATVVARGVVFDDRRYDVLTQAIGVYGQDQITLLRDRPLLHRLIAVVGGRYDYYRQSNDQGGNFFGAPDDSDVDISKGKFSPRLGLVWMPRSDLSLYGSWSRSFQPQDEFSVASDTPPEPQEAEQFEIGVKVEPTPNAQVTFSLFDILKENVPGPSPLGIGTELVGEERSRGFELEAAGTILEGWQLFGGYALIGAEVEDATDGTEGNELFDAPRHRFSLWTSYTVPRGGFAGFGGGGGLVYTGESYGDNANTVRLSSWRTVDAALWYRPEPDAGDVPVNLQLGVKNLLDERYHLGGNGFKSVTAGAPRTVYAGLSLRF